MLGIMLLKFHHPEKVGPNFLKVLERGIMNSKLSW